MPTYPDFPTISRKPSLKTRETTLDPTLRDSYENGMESTRARYTRRRREWSMAFEHITPADKLAIDAFVQTTAVYGAKIFLVSDVRDPQNPQTYMVRFKTLPSYTDDGNVQGKFRQNCTFELREV